jgi:hypothetical protein
MKKILICIPNRSNYVMAWALEHSINLAHEGASITVVDFSKLSSRYILSNFRWWIDNYSYARKSRRRMFLREFCRNNGITLMDLNHGTLLSQVKGLGLADNLRELFEATLKSSHARWYGSSEIAISDIPNDILFAEEISFKASYEAISQLLGQINFDSVITVNGRFIIDSAIVAGARESNVEYALLEKITEGWEFYNVFKISPQSNSERRQIVEREWKRNDNGSKSSKEQIAREYLQFRQSENWPWSKEVNANPRDLLNFDKGKFVTFFLTSDYEIPVHGSESYEDNLNQKEAIRTVSEVCNELDLTLVLRGHPHPGDSYLSSKENARFRKIADEVSATYIPCESPVNSLALAQASYANIVHGSTFAVDLIVKQIPVRTTNTADYVSFVKDIKAFDKESIRQYLLSPKALGTVDDLMPWAFTMKQGGIQMKHFQISDNSVVYEGRVIEKERSSLMRVRKLYAEVRGRRGDGPIYEMTAVGSE